MSFRFWTWISVGFLCLALVAFAYVSRKPLCIDSTLVERIDRAWEGGSSAVYECGLRRHVPFDPYFAENKSQLNRRLQSLERVFEWTSPLLQKVNITIFEGRPYTYRIHGHEIFISRELFESKNHLEKAILKVWFRERANLSLIKSPLIEEVYTDLFLYLWKGRLELTDLPSAIEISEKDPVRWPQVIRSWNSYCRSPWKMNEHLSVCNQVSSSSTKQFAAESLRPLMTKALIMALQQMSPQEKLLFMDRWAQAPRLWHLKMNSLVFPPTFADLQSQVLTFLNGLQASSPDPLMQKFVSLSQSQLSVLGFSENGPKPLVDLLVFKRDLNEQDRLILSSISQNESSYLIAAVTFPESQPAQVQIFPEPESFAVDIFGGIKASRGVFLFCGNPAWDDLISFTGYVDKLFTVHHCGDISELNLEFLMAGDEAKFIRSNSKVSMMAIHSESLRFAQRRADLSLSLMKQIFSNLGGVSRAKLDRHPLFEFDQDLKIYYWRGAVDSFIWVRP